MASEAEKTEEQIERERAAVEAMRNAKANMTASLDRIATLETALKAAKTHILALKGHVGPGSYTYPTDSSRVRCVDYADNAVAGINKVLGA